MIEMKRTGGSWKAENFKCDLVNEFLLAETSKDWK